MLVYDVQDLVKTYPGQTHPANDHISLQIQEGEIFGLLGDNGAGKTTLVRQAGGAQDGLAAELSGGVMNRPFIPGLQLGELFYAEAVRPILAARFPGLAYSAARLDGGSDVLGFDTPRSRDHDWGPRLMLFLAEADCEAYRERIVETLRRELPREIAGYPTNFDHFDTGETVLAAIESGPVNHRVTVHTTRSFFGEYLSYDPDGEPSVMDWLTFPEQRLRTIASGRVFHDGLGQLEPIRVRLRYYPRDVWLYLLAVQWRRISQEEAFVGRCGDVGDELGSRLIAARLVRELMKLCFLMERQYAPYSKWFGAAFARLDCAGRLLPIFERVLNAASWPERETHLSAAYETVAPMHNALGITAPRPTQVSRFHDRPYLVIHADDFADAIREAIVSDEVRALPAHLGAIDQFVDSTDVLDDPGRFGKLRLMYR